MELQQSAEGAGSLQPKSRSRGQRPHRVWPDAPHVGPSHERHATEPSELSSTIGVFREGSKNSTRGACAPQRDFRFQIQRTIQRFIQFGLVGGSGVLVDMGILFLLSDPKMLGWGLLLGKVLAAETAILNNFIWNDAWTFRDLTPDKSSWGGRMKRFGRFNLICLAGVGLNVLLLNIQVRYFHLNVYVANFIAIVLVCLWNFGMNLKFGWSKDSE